MGINILRELPQFTAFRLCGAVASEGNAAIGEDAAGRAGLPPMGVKVSAALPPLLREAKLAIDFSSARAAPATLAACVAARVPLLLGTTGLTRELAAPMAAAAESIALLVAPNTSPGLNAAALAGEHCGGETLRRASTSRSSRPITVTRPMRPRARRWRSARRRPGRAACGWRMSLCLGAMASPARAPVAVSDLRVCGAGISSASTKCTSSARAKGSCCDTASATAPCSRAVPSWPASGWSASPPDGMAWVMFLSINT